MILYISDEAHKSLLDWLDQDIQVRVLREPDMQIKFRKELPYMATVSHVIVEGSGIDRSTWDAAVELLTAVKQIPILLLTEEEEIADTWQKHERYTVLNRAHKDIKDELLRWLDQKEELSHTWIAVSGLTPSVGTTAFAMHIAAYITSQRQQVTVTELGDVYPVLADAYGWDELEEGVWNWGGTNYSHLSIDEACPYTVFDLGVINNKVYKLWSQCEIKILLADGKPYRLTKLGEKLKELRSFQGRIYLVFNYVPEAEKPVLRKRYNSDNVTVWFAPWQPDLFEVSGEYQDLLQGYLDPLPEEKKKVIPFRKRLERGKKKIVAGGIVLLALVAGYTIRQMAYQRQEERQMVVVSEPIPQMGFSSTTKLRLLMLEEEQATATEQVTTTEAVASETTEEMQAATEQIAQEKTSGKNGSKTATGTPGGVRESGGQSTTAVEVSTAATTEATTAAPPVVILPMTPSLQGYNGQIYTGDQVLMLMNKYAGQRVAMHLITRSGEGWYNYYTDWSSAAPVSTGIAQIDPQCSFLCQVLYANGESVGLEFVQQ